MNTQVELAGRSFGKGLHLKTLGRYSMNMAIEILIFLDQQGNVQVKNTGWKDGFGLDVSANIPITLPNATAQLTADGENIMISGIDGSKDSIERIIELIVSHFVY